jgi:hypothetical protein
MPLDSSKLVFFFGAGASAPFGIPTMKQFVVDFEKNLQGNANPSEIKLYKHIKEKLEQKSSNQVDLEAVFTVIDGIINYDQERLGLPSLYLAKGFSEPNEIDKALCISLRGKFRKFVKENCEIPVASRGKIKMVYKDFFNRFALENEFAGVDIGQMNEYAWQKYWSIFTTNYDTCLEHYWTVATGIGIHTGFEYDERKGIRALRPRKFLQEGIGVQLFKLHGSINWFIEKGSDTVIEVTTKGDSYVLREYSGEMMVYPIAEKELYTDPYISMLLRLNRELKEKRDWIVIGYSFNDPIIREIFLKNASSEKHLILVHPKAKDIFNRKLDSIKAKKSLMEKRFGLSEKDEDPLKKKTEQYKKVNHQIIHKLKENPRFQWHDNVVP